MNGTVVSATLGRTVGRARSAFHTALAVSGFLAATALKLAFDLEEADGSRMAFAAIWAGSVSPALPFLAALLGMDTWSEERQSGRIDTLLATAVRERDLVFGKFLGVCLMTAGTTAFSLASALAALWLLAPGTLAGVSAVGLAPALAGVLVQGALWCAVSVAASAMFRHGSAAAAFTLAVLVGVPRGIWAGMMSWARDGRVQFGTMPLDAHVFDMASGTIPVGTIAAYLGCAAAVLLVASKSVTMMRLTGRGAAGARVTTVIAMLLALTAATLFAALTTRTDFTLDLPFAGLEASLSPRTRGILAESGGDITVTCFLSRNDTRFKPIGRFLRSMKRESDAVGGARFTLRYVDPRWDIGAAERLVRRGVTENGLVFEKGRRMVDVRIEDGYGERTCASAIRRLTSVSQRHSVYWTVGHGEASFEEYGAFGMSDIAREMARDGFRNRTLDLATAQQMPGDCALVVVAGAKDAFSRAELGRLDAYLREGGRVLTLLGADRESGVSPLLPSWGIRPVETAGAGLPTLSGSNVIASEFSGHAIASSLGGSRIVLERPVAFAPSAVAEVGAGAADRITFAPVASVGKNALVAAAERGGKAGSDLAIRPTRIVAIGDESFAMNGSLASRANANRDFFLNCVSYLSGTDVTGYRGVETDVLRTGLDRKGRERHVILTALALPGLVLLVLGGEALRRRRRT